jgi:Dolichyl-phosphate-mannose-protein mannosyltransferase
MRDRRSRNVLIVVALAAFLARLAVVWPKLNQVADDPDNYVDLARSLRIDQSFALRSRTTAYRPPLYPLLLAPLIGPPEATPRADGLPWTTTRLNAGIAGLHLLLGAGAALLTSVAARRFGLGDRRALLAGLIVALDPVLVIQSRSIMTETLAAMLIAWAIAAAAKGGWKGAVETGFALGLAALCRPSTLAGSALCVVFCAMTGRELWRDRFIRAFLMIAMIVATLAPWAVRNRLALGEFVWTTTHGGYTLALANNPDYYRDVLDGPPGAVWGEDLQRSWAERIARETSGLSEPEADRQLAKAGWGMLRDRPGDFLRASLARIGRFWAVRPSAAVYGWKARWASAAWSVPLFALAILGLSSRESWRWPMAIAPAFLLGISCVHLIYWTDMRMRAPIVPAIALAAANGVRTRKKILEKNPDSSRGHVVDFGAIG